ncbi:NUDIX domain-containing protein [Streptococcus merionis]|nr:NUDIX domain-containing protein [Streptococcus merionis]
MELPGGRMTFGETIEEALVRELMEETGLSVIPIKVLNTWNYMKKTGDFQVAGLIHAVKVTELSHLRLSEEHDSYQWLSFEELDKLVPHLKISLSKVVA